MTAADRAEYEDAMAHAPEPAPLTDADLDAMYAEHLARRQDGETPDLPSQWEAPVSPGSWALIDPAEVA